MNCSSDLEFQKFFSITRTFFSHSRSGQGQLLGQDNFGIKIPYTLESVIDIGQGISKGPGRFGKKNKRRALNKRRAWKIWKKE